MKLTSLQLDASSFSVHGKYEGEPPENKEEEGSISITHGYCRDQRPDLKHFLVDLMASSDEGVPVFFDTASGNDSAKDRFTGLSQRYKELVDVDALFVADSALYSSDKLTALTNLRWVTSVALTLKEAKRVLDVTEDAFVNSAIPG